MTWSVTFSNDTALPDVGSVTATWSAPGESQTIAAAIEAALNA